MIFAITDFLIHPFHLFNPAPDSCRIIPTLIRRKR
nr:MAG TPA: angiotensinogen [Caudoviricetes sp.]